MTSFIDRIPMRTAKRVIDTNGFAHVPAVITGVGVQQYTKDQLGIPGVSGPELVNVFRGPETVFHEDTISSFKHLPITDQHPPAGVSPQNAKLVQGGHTGEDVVKMSDSDLGVTIHLTDEVFIFKSKGSETSAGYDATIVKDSGEYNGQKYEYRFDGAMIGNHLALVDRGRVAGARVLDEKHNKETHMEKAEVQALIADAIKVNNTALTAQFGDTLKQTLADHQAEQDQKKADAEAKAKADADEKQKADDQKKADADAIRASVEMRHKIKPLLGDKFDDAKTDKELLVLCFDGKVEGAADKSEEYLTACLDQEVKDRKNSKTPPSHSDSIPVGGVVVKAI